MASICPALQKLLDAREITPAAAVNLLLVDRRKLIDWQIRRSVGTGYTYDTVRATTERMNRRAAAGLPFNLGDMAKVARPQKATVVASKVKKPAKKAKVASSTVASAPVHSVPVSAPKPKTHVILVFDESGSMVHHSREINAQTEAIRQRLIHELPEAEVDVLCFGTYLYWMQRSVKARNMGPLSLTSERGGTSLYEATTAAAIAARANTASTLVYLLTDGEATDSTPRTATRSYEAVTAALATGRVTFACVGPANASRFFDSCGIPKDCIRQWDGVDRADLNKVTQQVAQGVSNYAVARSAGKAKIDSFFVDVVASGLDVAKAKRELRNITTSLRRRKISKFEEVQKYVTNELKITYVAGAAYYPISKPETLKKGRRIILQPRGEDVYLAGPNARKLLGLPDDRDVKVEPKNLGDFVIYFQSASPNRKLLPGTTLLYDESHVPGATEPTWSRAS